MAAKESLILAEEAAPAQLFLLESEMVDVDRSPASWALHWRASFFATIRIVTG